MNGKKLTFIVWLRAFAVLLILACHFTQQSGNTYFIMSSQFFNIGNSVFFILSGFLFGKKSKTESQTILSWYKKRILRIYLPYEMMLMVLFVVDLIVLKSVDFSRWIPQFLGVQAWNGVFGATQTWFVTSILLCYLFTPILAKMCNEIQNNQRATLKLILFFAIVPAILPYVINGIFVDASIITPISWYSLAFVIGTNFEKIVLTKQKALFAFILMLLSFGVRLIGRWACDGTILYNQIISAYTQAFGAFCIFLIFGVCFEQTKPWKIVTLFSKISFEVYLWHYMFTDGPLKLFGVTGYWVCDCVVTLGVSVSLAVGANWTAKCILQRLR